MTLGEVMRTLERQVAPEHSALLVVDVQNDFCHTEGGLAVAGADMTQIQDMVPRLARLIRHAHAAGVLVVFLRIVQTPVSNSEAWEALEPPDGPRLVVDGEWGAEYYEGLPHECMHVEMVKHRHSAFAGTELDKLLRERGRKTVILGGVATNVCVEGTAREAADRDYYVVVVGDGTAAARVDLHEMTLENVRSYLGVVTSCAELEQLWAARASEAA